MDIKIEKKPWYIRHRYYLLGGTAFVIFLIYVISLSFGPRKLRIETDNIQIAEVKNDKFMEYVDVEGLVQPILTNQDKLPAKPAAGTHHRRRRNHDGERRFHPCAQQSRFAALYRGPTR